MSFAELTGRRILITGASSGIGRAIALACAEAGADVILNCRRSLDQSHAVADEIRGLGVRSEVIPADVSDDAAAMTLCGQVLAGGSLDAVVNNAGADLLTSDLKHASYEQRLEVLLQTDVLGTVRLSRLLGQHFLQQRRGVILNIGWDQADRGMGGESGELFAVAKNAVMGFTRSLSLSLAPHVRVNCIAPGWVRTAWGETAGEYWQQRVLQETPLERWGTPRDIACMARFLLSDEAAWVTGQVINVNGGAVR